MRTRRGGVPKRSSSTDFRNTGLQSCDQFWGGIACGSPRGRCGRKTAVTAPAFLCLARISIQGDMEDSMFEGLFQPTHLLMIAGIALLVLGPKKLPELGKGLGESIRGFKSAMAAKEADKLVTPKSESTTGNPS